MSFPERLGADKARLRDCRDAMVAQVGDVRLALHPGKSRTHRCGDGFTFLGWLIFPSRMRLLRGNPVRFGRRMKQLQADFQAGLVDYPRVDQSVRAWIAHASAGNTLRLRERRLERFAFVLGARPPLAGGVVQQQ